MSLSHLLERLLNLTTSLVTEGAENLLTTLPAVGTNLSHLSVLSVFFDYPVIYRVRGEKSIELCNRIVTKWGAI